MGKKKKNKSKEKNAAVSQRQGSIVLVGVCSFKGLNLLKQLEADPRYENVVAIDVREPRLALKKTKFYRLDLTETLADDTLAKILKKEKCDTLVHMAFPITPPKNESYAHEVVAIGSYYIVNACEAAKVRKLVLATTTDVYGAFATNPNYLTEDMPPKGNQQSRFLGDKIDAEKQALKYAQKHPGTMVTILRPCTILGPTINSYKTRFLQRPVITTMMGFDPLVQFVHEEDVIASLKILVDEDHPGIFNLAGDGVLPLSRVIELAGKVNLQLTQIGFKTLVQALWLMDIAPAPASHVDFLRYICVVDNTKVKKVLGYTPKYTTKETLLSFIGADRLRQINLEETISA